MYDCHQEAPGCAQKLFMAWIEHKGKEEKKGDKGEKEGVRRIYREITAGVDR